MAGMIGGAVGGAITGGLQGGWKGALMGAAMGGVLGGLGGWAAGLKNFTGNMILGGMAATGIGLAAATDSWDSFAGGIAGGLAGLAIGNSINGAIKGPNLASETGSARIGSGENRAGNSLTTDQKPEIGEPTGRGHYLKASNTNPESGISTTDELFVNDGNRQITVIGARKDTLVAKDWPNHNVLDLSKNEYSWPKNVQWLDKAVARNDVIYMATDPKACTGTYGRTYLQEISYLESEGYVQKGNYMIREK
jgi:hypothetical protein